MASTLVNAPDMSAPAGSVGERGWIHVATMGSADGFGSMGFGVAGVRVSRGSTAEVAGKEFDGSTS